MIIGIIWAKQCRHNRHNVIRRIGAARRGQPAAVGVDWGPPSGLPCPQIGIAIVVRILARVIMIILWSYDYDHLMTRLWYDYERTMISLWSFDDQIMIIWWYHYHLMMIILLWSYDDYTMIILWSYYDHTMTILLSYDDHIMITWWSYDYDQIMIIL